MSALRFLASLTVAGMLAACQAPRRAQLPTPDPVAVAAVASTPAATPSPRPDTPAASPPPSQLRLAVEPPIRRADELLRRWQARLADAPCVQDRVVQRWEQTFARWPTRFSRQIEAVLPLMAHAVEALESHALPGEFALLPVVESWYRPDAGRAAATLGMWQFAAATARSHGVRIISGYDGRMAPAESTRAAMRHLSGLLNRFGDWRLATMAYNAGEYRLAGALSRASTRDVSPEAHRPPGLSPVTYEHLAKLRALVCLLAQPQRFGIDLPMATPIEPLRTIVIDATEASLQELGDRAGISHDIVHALNPAFLGGRIRDGATREVLLPESAALHYARTRPAAHDARIGVSTQGTFHLVQRGDTLGQIARRHGLRLADLLRWNGLEAADPIHPGQRLRLAP